MSVLKRTCGVLSELFNGAVVASLAFLMIAQGMSAPLTDPVDVPPAPEPQVTQEIDLKTDFNSHVPGAAIGLLRMNGKQCTAAVGPDKSTILTAAHCVSDLILGEYTQPVFMAKFKHENGKDEFIEKANVTAISYAKELEVWKLKDQSKGAPYYDIAILKLDKELGDQVQSFSFNNENGINLSIKGTYNQSGYGKMGNVLASDLQCQSITVHVDNIKTDCYVVPGDSGSPLYRNTEDGESVILGVIYSRNEEQSTSWAIPINDNVKAAYEFVSELPQSDSNAISVYKFDFH